MIAQEYLQTKSLLMTDQQKQSVASAIVNLTKNLLGAGMLSLPMAFSLTGDYRIGLFLLTLVSIMSGSTFIMLGHACRLTGERTFRGLVQSLFGGRLVWLVDLTIAFNSFFACLALLAVIGDFLSRSLTSYAGHAVSRVPCVALIGFLVILPLCLLPRLESLKSFSAVGLIASSYAIGYVIVDSIKCQPLASPAEGTLALHASTLKSWALFSTCFLGHYNAPKFFSELAHPNQFTRFCAISYTLVALVYVLFAIAGYHRFGDSVHGDVLESYTKVDGWLNAAWLSMGFGITFTYPLVFSALKEIFNERFRSSLSSNPNGSMIAPLIIVPLTILIAAYSKDVSTFNAIKGASSATILGFILPPAIYIKAVSSHPSLLSTRRRASFFWCRIVMYTGGILGLFSVGYLCLNAISNKPLFGYS